MIDNIYAKSFFSEGLSYVTSEQLFRFQRFKRVYMNLNLYNGHSLICSPSPIFIDFAESVMDSVMAPVPALSNNS